MNWDREFDIVRKDEEKQIVYGVVLEPETEDAQEDIVPIAEVEKACHRFAIKYAKGVAQMGLDHDVVVDRANAPLVENFIAPVDYAQGEKVVRKGSWVIGVHIPDKDLWGSVKDGTQTGYSISGHGLKQPA